ncbi:tetratricopeptide repeat protein [Pseudofrankia inefficax]|uniref:Tetratricopeptide repeat protein n=1 Tax=Pseudofrankia inefficax (strain DSM 45817 / CECT 9037 / DDB 130130 / EuI1c) TaxID=298654 RepID=E3J6I5_PSEI1|nr:tetratricopeptide repeat protein [Pseudofrankia inefficax]ADP80761.1 hypothetical protein FraEuI1c_2730 [Pseudofrankia inefficax]
MSRSLLAEAYQAAGRHADASHWRDILADRIRVLGADHPDTLRTRSFIADSLQETTPEIIRIVSR